MITRIWHGWTARENADAYQELLRTKILPGIHVKPGCRGISLLRRDAEGEVEFVTILQFDSLDAIRAFAGANYEVAVVPPEARRLLSRFDPKSAHYETVLTLKE
jgi:antibiotic biosynthesis monooxygenase (ABM) superfamily enzyme